MSRMARAGFGSALIVLLGCAPGLAAERAVAVSHEAVAVLPSVEGLFNGLAGTHRWHKGEPVDPLEELRQGFPTDRYHIMILTTHELASLAAVEGAPRAPGRVLEGQWVLVRRSGHAVADDRPTKVAAPERPRSFRWFVTRVHRGCILQGQKDPTLVKADGAPEVMLVKLWEGARRFHDPLMVRDVVEAWGRAYPVPYAAPNSSRTARDELKACLKSNHLELRENVPAQTILRLVPGIKPDGSGPRRIETAVQQDQLVALAHERAELTRFRASLRGAYERLRKRYRAEGTRYQGARVNLREYLQSHRVLESGDGPILAAARVDYEYARYTLDLLQKMTPVGGITRTLAGGRALHPAQRQAVEVAAEAHEDYWRLRAELQEPRQHIDIESLWARAAVAQLRFFLHQHHELQGDAARSREWLRAAQEAVRALREDLDTVRQGTLPAHERLRARQDFREVEGRLTALAPITAIGRR